MTSTKLARYLQGTVIPFAFLVAPAVSQVACAGATQQANPPQPEDEEPPEWTGQDPYDGMCESARRMGSGCPSREEWYRGMGLCSDGTKDCQK